MNGVVLKGGQDDDHGNGFALEKSWLFQEVTNYEKKSTTILYLVGDLEDMCPKLF